MRAEWFGPRILGTGFYPRRYRSQSNALLAHADNVLETHGLDRKTDQPRERWLD